MAKSSSHSDPPQSPQKIQDKYRKVSVISAVLAATPETIQVITTASNPEKADKTDSNSPKDNFHFVLIGISLLGLVHLLPFSYFTTANEYWMFKFRNTTLNTTNANQRTYLQTNFVTLTGICSMAPTIALNFLMTIFAHKIRPETRVMAALLLDSIIFGILVVFVEVDTDTWQEIFFVAVVILMLLVMSSVTFSAAAQYNLITRLPPQYLKGYLHGEGFASLFNATIRLISVLISPSALGSGLIYFTTGTILMGGTSVSSALILKSKFFRYHTKSSDDGSKENIRNMGDMIEVLKYIWPMIILNAIILLLPLNSLYNLVVSESFGDGGTVWGNQYFVTVCTFLIPAISNIMGRTTFNLIDWDCSLPLQYIIVILYQAMSLVALMFSNARPRSHLPVLLKHDWEYAAAMAAYSFGKGFISNMTIIKTVKLMPPDKTELGMLIIFFFNSIWGVSFSFIGLWLVNII